MSRLKGKRAYLVGKRGEDYGFEGVTFVSELKDAEIVLVLGSNAPETSLDEYRRFFEGVAHSRRLLQSGQADAHVRRASAGARRHRRAL